MERPKTRGDCLPMFKERFIDKVPCPWVSCKYNTFLTVKRNGEIEFNHGTEDVTELKVPNCVLDYVDACEQNQLVMAAALGMPTKRHQTVQIAIERALYRARRTEYNKDVDTPSSRVGHPLAEAQAYSMAHGNAQ